MSVLEVKNITKKFGKTEVLRGIDFSLEKGEVLSIIGSSGSGKTTLLRCLNFLETPDTGEIYVDGKCIFDSSDPAKKTSAEIRENRLNFGMVFQSFNLFPQYSVFDNITLAPRLRAKEEAKAKKLLAAFGGLRGLKRASEAEIAAVKGIGVKDAAAVRAYFDANEGKKKG